MDVRADLITPVDPQEVFAWIQDLATYPEWLDIVARAEPDLAIAETQPSDALLDEKPDAVPDETPAWSVDLRARLGPLARSKRLRMVRTRCQPPSLVVFERRELDGRSHSPWVLSARVTAGGEGAAPGGSVLHMHLHYGGRLAGKPLEMVLAGEIERSRPRLLELLGRDYPPEEGRPRAQ